MNKLLISLTLIVFSVSIFSNGPKIAGSWKCHMFSEYAEQDSDFLFKPDSHYKKESNMFGSTHIELGSWEVKGNNLILERRKYIKNDKEQDSNQVFNQEIISLTNAELLFKNGSSKTTCKK